MEGVVGRDVVELNVDATLGLAGVTLDDADTVVNQEPVKMSKIRMFIVMFVFSLTNLLVRPLGLAPGWKGGWSLTLGTLT